MIKYNNAPLMGGRKYLNFDIQRFSFVSNPYTFLKNIT